MQNFLLKKKLTLFLLPLIAFFSVKNAFSRQDRFSEDYYRNYYATDYSYNIFSADTWNISPYVFIGYAYGWVPYYNRITPSCCRVNYGDMLRNGHNGFIIGTGITINRNWSIGISFQELKRSSSIRKYERLYPEINKIKSDLFLANFDLAVRLPFNLFKNRLDFHTIVGLNIITANLGNKYNQDATVVPIELTLTPHKVSLGTNIGFSITYRIISGFYIKTECRKMFILTRRHSLIKDSWLMNIVFGMNF